MASGTEIFIIVFILLLVVTGIILTIYFVWRNDQKKRDGPNASVGNGGVGATGVGGFTGTIGPTGVGGFTGTNPPSSGNGGGFTGTIGGQPGKDDFFSMTSLLSSEPKFTAAVIHGYAVIALYNQRRNNFTCRRYDSRYTDVMRNGV